MTIFFILGFIIILAWLIITMFLIIARMIELNTDVLDVSYSMIGYFTLLTYYYFAQVFFPKVLVLDITLMFIRVGAFTHVFLPFVALVLAITIGQLNKKNDGSGFRR